VTWFMTASDQWAGAFCLLVDSFQKLFRRISPATCMGPGGNARIIRWDLLGNTRLDQADLLQSTYMSKETEFQGNEPAFPKRCAKSLSDFSKVSRASGLIAYGSTLRKY
jgi:hypothetical protein